MIALVWASALSLTYGSKNTPPVGVQVPLLLHSLHLPLLHSEACITAAQRKSAASGLGCKTRGKSSIHAHCVI